MTGPRPRRRGLLILLTGTLAAVALLAAAIITGASGTGATNPVAAGRDLLLACLELDDPETHGSCLDEQITKLARSLGAYDAESALILAAAANPAGTEPFCHETAHTLGALTATEDRIRGERYMCEGGNWHGSMATVGERTTLERFVELAIGNCDDLTAPALPPILFRDCAHGVGHGLASGSRVDPPAMYRACTAVFTNPDALQECFLAVAGTLLERRYTENLPVPLLERTPERWCDGIDVGKEACTRSIAGMLAVEGKTFDQMAASCMATPDPVSCAREAGMQFAGRASTHRDAVAACATFPGIDVPVHTDDVGIDPRTSCLRSLVQYLTSVAEMSETPNTICAAFPTESAVWCDAVADAYAERELSPSEVATLYADELSGVTPTGPGFRAAS